MNKQYKPQLVKRVYIPKNNDKSHTLHLIRLFLRAGIMGNGLVISSTIGMPQGRTTFANTIKYIFR